MKKLAYLFSLLAVSVNAHAWYTIEGVDPGQKLTKCKLNSSTPAKEIKEMEELNWTVELSDEVKDADGKILSLKMVKVIPSSWVNQGGINTMLWFRTKDVCIEGRQKASQIKLNEEKINKLNEEAYKRRIAPYE